MGISRLRMGIDGKGVVTLVCFFGCPLHCKYCLNEHCHESWNTARAVYTPKELIEVLKKDDIYYRMTGGGITFGGGEPLLQSAFIHEVCQQADKAWKKRIETSLNVPWECVEPVINDIDEWIIDIKDMDSELYKTYTGTDNENLKSNLLRLKDCTKPSKIRIRVPLIQGFNDKENVEKSVKWIKENLQVEPEVFNYIVPGQIKYVPEPQSGNIRLPQLSGVPGVRVLPNGEREILKPNSEIESSEWLIENRPLPAPEEMIELIKKEKQRREELRKNR